MCLTSPSAQETPMNPQLLPAQFRDDVPATAQTVVAFLAEKERLEVVDYLRALPRLWADAGPDGRQALVAAIFAKLDVLGFQSLEYDLTPDAIDLGLDVALPARMQLDYQIGEFGRGERI